MELQDPSMMITSPQKAIEVVEEEEEGAPLPGFRFHPTDEEVVSFYLKRKIEEKPLSIELIKQIDIYKYDPWDLAKVGSVGDKEWYFYCKRGRKYKNSVRPNRVTGSGGFWKATGIDRPIYDSNNVAANKFAAETGKIVGLKKSLVYYRGTAGKGSKTDWMMHEFRLPSTSPHLHQAEIWTLCRIFKRSQKQTPDWREFPSKRVSITTNSNNITSPNSNNNERYISFSNPSTTTQQQQQQRQQYDNHCIKHSTKRSLDELQRLDVKSKSVIHSTTSNPNPNNYHNFKGQWASPLMDYQANPSQLASNFSSPLNSSSSLYDQDQGDDVNYWEDLSSVVEFAIREIYNQN